MRAVLLLTIIGLALSPRESVFAGKKWCESRPTLVIQWQRLIIGKGETCPRCGDTEKSVAKARKKLSSALKPLGIKVVLEKSALGNEEFAANPAESNRIRLNGRPLEEILGAEVGSSPCWGACGDKECRTLTVDGQSFESIPSEMIIRAGLLVAADILHAAIPSCSDPENGCGSSCGSKVPADK
jgi:hypothetical protein